MRNALALAVPVVDRRFVNSAVPLRCPDCHRPILAIISLRQQPERAATIRCLCGFSVSYSGPGVMADRRAPHGH
jgi:hypothetical protein